METGFDSRTQKLGDPVICTQLYFCGGAGDEQIERIMKRGFSKEGALRRIFSAMQLQRVFGFLFVFVFLAFG